MDEKFAGDEPVSTEDGNVLMKVDSDTHQKTWEFVNSTLEV